MQNQENKNVDTFDVEQAIMAAWGTADDIKALYEYYYDAPEKMSHDEMANALLGLHVMHHIKCQKLFNLYEQLLKRIKI